jgi:bifunctional non-homologous end joining protein LigD
VAVRARSSKPASKSASPGDPLEDYKRKRDFSRTAEPKPETKPKPKSKSEPDRDHDTGWQFVVQKHDARRVHYDLRLEHRGTLKSWAVTRGPSLVVGEKRLAVRTEDHPMQYLDFEGNIPKGEYGGGAMIVWDRGRWEPAFDADKGLQKGHLEIVLHGKRLKGRWHLVRMRPRPGEKKEQWLLIKADDEFARPAGEGDITDEETTSTVSGRTTQELAAEGELRKDHAGRAKVMEARKRVPPDPQKVRGARKGILPAFLEPSLPQVADTAPSGPKWVHEIKYDGYRVQARIDGEHVRLLTRKALDWTSRFTPVAAALKTLGLSSALIDGEIVVEDSAGIPSFTLLQADLSALRRDRFRYFVFDLYYCEGFDLTQAALTDRKALLQQIVEGGSAWKALCRSAAICHIGAAAATIGSRSRVCCGRNSSSWATFPRPPQRVWSARCCSATSTAERFSTPAALAPAIPAVRPDRCARSSRRSRRPSPSSGTSFPTARRRACVGRSRSSSARSNIAA